MSSIVENKLQEHAEPHGPHAVPPVTNWPPNLRRSDASRYLQKVYEIVVQPSTLAKWHCLRLRRTAGLSRRQDAVVSPH